MHYTEIIHSCSHHAVAAAAVRSIGGEFHSRIELLAGAHGLSLGAYTAQIVLEFAAKADSDTWRDLASAIARRDMPVLAGLRFIVEERLNGKKQSGKTASNPRHGGVSSDPAKPAPFDQHVA